MTQEETNHINQSDQPEPELLVRYLCNEATDEESADIEQWMKKDGETKRALIQTARLFYTKRAYDRMAMRNPVKAFHKVEEQIERKNRRRRLTPLLYTAASLAGAVIISLFFLLWQQQTNAYTADVWLRANPGVKARVTLPDGSVAELNSGSRIGYHPSFGKSERKLQLSGEALFRVKKSNGKPFTVCSTDGRSEVQVLGTTFNVQSFDNEEEFATMLIEGAVEVTSVRSDGTTVINHLTPNKKLTFNKKTDSLFVMVADPEVETAWTQDKIVFNRTKMYEVIKRLVYNYNVEFEIKNPDIYQYEFTGTFENQQLQQVLDYLKITSHIHYTIIYPSTENRDGTQRPKVILHQ